MKIKKRLLIVTLVMISVCMFLPNKVKAITASELKEKLDNVRYNDSELRDGITYDGYYYGSTCYAFANKVASKVFGSSHYNNPGAWQDYYDLNNLCIGDVVEYYEPASTSGLHCFIVTNLDGDNIEVTDSNYVGPYLNKWAKGWTTKYDLRPDANNATRLKVVWHFKDNNVKKFETDTENPSIVDCGVDMSSITSTSFKVRVKATDNVGVTQVGLNIWAPNQDRVWRLASYNSSTGYWEYTIRKSDFGNASGLYDFDTYVSDAAGNSVSRAYSAFPMGSTVVTNLGNFTARIAMKGNTNYVIGTEGTASKSSAVLKTKSLSDNSQVWKFSKNSDNTYTITHVASGHVLDIYNYSNENGAKVQIYPNANTNNQKFYIMSYNGGYRIVPKGSNDAKAVDNANGKITNGNKIDLYEAYSINNAAQTWTFEKVELAKTLTIGATSVTVEEGKTSGVTILINGKEQNFSNLSLSSSNTSVATVSHYGSNMIITAKKQGTATITVKTTDGSNLTKTCRVIVTKPSRANVSYSTHIQNEGWQNYMSNGATSGTMGKSLRLEGIKINLDSTYSGNIEYRTHVQNLGWQDYVTNGSLSGTSGKSLRLEAIQIRLTGNISNYYDVYYRVYVQRFGWLDWAKNGEEAGTAGYAYRLEGIQIKLVPKNTAAPGNTATPFKQTYVAYRTHIQNVGWQEMRRDGGMAGTIGKGYRLEGIEIVLTNQKYAGNIEYRTHVQNLGWQNWARNRAMSGTSGKGLRLEAIEIKLTGEMANHYDVYYRVHSQNFGWLGWAKNGETAGTTRYGYRLEGIEIKLVEKGSPAPGSTANAYRTK